MLGPRTNGSRAASSGGSGGTSIEVFTAACAGRSRIGGSSPSSAARSRGSAISPVNAAAAAVSGEHSHTRSSRVPDRPGKLRGTVRSELWPTAGACPIPMHPRHPVWWRRAPAARSVKVAPIRVRSSKISRDDGLTSTLTESFVWRPSSIAATTAKSRSPGLAEEPITTWPTGSPATSRTGTTLSGEDGLAINGSSVDRSISSVWW